MSLPISVSRSNSGILSALLLLAVDPGLKGLMIAGGAGIGKSQTVRTYRNLLPAPYLEVPLNVTIDRLLGGLDLAQTLASRQRKFVPGLLASAHGGTLYLDEINLLDTTALNQIASALSDGLLRIEREGFSELTPCNFLLIGSYDPAEGELRATVLDRVGLIITPAPMAVAEQRSELIEQALQHETNNGELALELDLLRGVIADARARLSTVTIDRESRRMLSLAALELGVPGNRADLFATRAARAHAALCGRNQVESSDLELAIQLVLVPRATTLPDQPEPPTAETTEQPERSQQTTSDQASNQTGDQTNAESTEQTAAATGAAIQDLLIKAIDSALPVNLLAIPTNRQRHAKAGSRGETINQTRGRNIGETADKRGGSKISVVATLRAAAQQARPKSAAKSVDDCAITIKPADLRFKRFKQKAGMLFIFAVDASGSMALNRMNQAKGALTRLLQQAYVHRDKVALISFRGNSAEVMLPVSQSVERAKRALDALPVGGGTPLAAGLLSALELARRARRQGIRQTLLLLFTDGRANVSLTDTTATDRSARAQTIQQELAQLSAALQHEEINVVVIDTQHRFTSGGAGELLARRLAARYVYLPRADATGIYHAMRTIAESIR